MTIDMRTMIIVVGLVHLFQFAVFYSLYRINHKLGGLKFWLAWSILEVVGFSAMFMREIPGIFPLVVFIQNGSIVGGIICLYLGVAEFSEGKADYRAGVTGLITFLLFFTFFLLVHDDKNIRGITINLAISTFTALVSLKLFRIDVEYLKNISRILGATFVIHALIFIYRSVGMAVDPRAAEFMTPHIWNTIPAFDAFAVSLIWTYGFFLMVNKRLIHEKEVNREYFESAFYGSPDTMVITNIGDGRLLDCNTAFLENFGFTREEVIGKTTVEIDLWVDLELRNKLIARVMEENSISNLEAEFKKKNGEIRNCLISSTIIKSDGRNVMLSVLKDITPIKQFEEEVKRSEEKYRLLTETTPDFVLMHDTEGTIQYVNSSALNNLGYSQDELVGQHIMLLSSKKNLMDAYARREKRLSGEFGIMQYNLEVVKKDGTTFPMEVRSAPIIRNGLPDSIVLVARDITEQLKQLDELLKTKEAAEQMNLLKSHFFANMSHELRTPFVGIMGYAQILLETVSDPENLAMIQNILNGAKRLTDTLDKILSLAQLDFNEIEITSEEIGVNNIVRDVISNHYPDAARKNIKLKFEPLREEPSVFCDRKILNSILDKLISNAVKYSENGTVEVIAEVIEQDCGKGKLVVSIKDEGMGIETEKQDIIWQPFRQASEGRGRSFEGTGLGLSITRRFIELLGGEISLISKPGLGSVFTFSIPVEIPGKTNTIIA